MKKILIVLGMIIVLGVGYYLISPLFITKEVDDELPGNIVSEMVDDEKVPSGFESLSDEEQKEMLLMMEELNKEDSEPMEDSDPKDVTEETANKYYQITGSTGHPASGRLQILETANGTVIRFEDFETINGPNLHLYLANDLRASDFVDLGPIRGTKGNINYLVPEGVDISKYKYVMHWCVPFGVLFNYADISEI